MKKVLVLYFALFVFVNLQAQTVESFSTSVPCEYNDVFRKGYTENYALAPIFQDVVSDKRDNGVVADAEDVPDDNPIGMYNYDPTTIGDGLVVLLMLMLSLFVARVRQRKCNKHFSID